VADSFDAMANSRTYRRALPVSEAIRRIREGAEGQYDPRLVVAFDRALADGTLALPLTHPGDRWVPSPRVDVAPSRARGMRGGGLRIVG